MTFPQSYIFTLFLYHWTKKAAPLLRCTAFCLIILSTLLSCSEPTAPHTFYYWRTTASLDPSEKAALDKATTPYLYMRFFDIEKKSGKFQPIALVQNTASFKTDKKIIPVVFIKNEVFYDISLDDIEFLAQNIESLVRKKYAEFSALPITEIQIDCDWTAGTNKEYFAFLKKLKEKTRANITCTLRLHQVKDRALSGVPPVDKVYLMCYSTTSPLEDSDINSILDMTVLRNYLKNIDQYPLDIDVALPIFSWGIVTNHNGKHRLINAFAAKDLNHPDLKKLSPTKAVVLKDGFYFGNYLSKGFTIKIEEISPEQLRELKNFLSKKLTGYQIVYYHLDAKFLGNFGF